MAAPTPVRALVHSSTLVTAGVVLLLKFLPGFSNRGLLSYLFLIGLRTILVAGTSAMMEFDFKKLVALSTLSQIGFLFLIISQKTK